jgi:hypothetical protein
MSWGSADGPAATAAMPPEQGRPHRGVLRTLDLASGWQVVPYSGRGLFVPGTLTLHKIGDSLTERERERNCLGF